MMYRSREDGRYDKYVERVGRGYKFYCTSIVMEKERSSPDHLMPCLWGTTYAPKE